MKVQVLSRDGISYSHEDYNVLISGSYGYKITEISIEGDILNTTFTDVEVELALGDAGVQFNVNPNPVKDNLSNELKVSEDAEEHQIPFLCFFIMQANVQ